LDGKKIPKIKKKVGILWGNPAGLEGSLPPGLGLSQALGKERGRLK